MIEPDDASSPHATQAGERGAALVLLPLTATILFYSSPTTLQQHSLFQFFPQACAYAAFIAWSTINGSVARRIGLARPLVPQGLRWGLFTGLTLGLINVLVILYLVPILWGDYRFLADTPHAKIPLLIMVPWFILLIATMVELNFRGCLRSIPFWWQPFNICIGLPSGTAWCGVPYGSCSETSMPPSWPTPSKSSSSTVSCERY